GEYEAGHIPGAHQLHGGRVLWRLGELPRDKTIVTHCQTGSRSAVIASLLRASGFEGVAELEGSYEAWRALREKTSA
ncbi:MAG: rhodanese-like domain-containing protein, partial [Actinomycetota bacterium]